MMRKPLVVGNWKMETSHKGAIELTRALKKLLQDIEVTADVVICPSFPSLAAIAETVKNSERLQIGAQHVHWEEKGAFTGSVSVTQISSFARWCIVGHSEVRELLDLSDEQVVEQIRILLTHGLTPIICIGETLAEREAERTIAKITSQAESIFATISRTSLSKLVITYEPIWAISSQGPAALPDPQEVAEMAGLIRKIAASKFDAEAAERLRVLYGGSVNSDNVRPYVSEPGVDGVLVGGASVHPLQFVEIVKIVQAAAA